MELRNRLSLELGNYQAIINKRLEQLEKENFSQRLWKKEPALWTSKIDNPEIALGWLDVIPKIEKELPAIESFATGIRDAGFNHIVLLGMGGSSLAPMVLNELFEKNKNSCRFTVIDTTEPEIIKKTAVEINIATLFIVSSKSGGTAEVKALYEYFYSLMHELKKEKSGENFVAITDEGSPLVELSKKNNFRNTFINFPEIGGRFSALSYFGIIPAALMGIDLTEFINRSKVMASLCGPDVPANKNPGMQLGCALAELALAGHDKLIYSVSKEMSSFGLWLEQLIAESTGKEGKGIFPIEYNSGIGSLTKQDKVLLQIELAKKVHEQKENPTSGSPLIRIALDDALDIGAEFYRWEIATATAGAILGINPFDQPNVEESKKITSQVLNQICNTGNLPPQEISYIHDSVKYYSTHKASNGQLLMEKFFADSRKNDYIVLQAYLPETPDNHLILSQIAIDLEKNMQLPVSIQYGPRYLHSTGQYHKGGPDNGFFIQLVSCSEDEILIPGRSYTFGLLKRAQAAGDKEALTEHGKNVILIDAGKNIKESLLSFRKITEKIQPVDKRNAKYVYAYNHKEEAFEMSYGFLIEEQSSLNSIRRAD